MLCYPECFQPLDERLVGVGFEAQYGCSDASHYVSEFRVIGTITVLVIVMVLRNGRR